VKRQSPVAHAELEEVVRAYRHALVEYRRAPRGGRIRRHLGRDVRRLRARFDGLLAGAGLDGDDQAAWLRTLVAGAPAPAAPVGAARLVFRGLSGSRAELRLLAREDGRLDAFMDGAAVGALPGDRGLVRSAPSLVYELGGVTYRETFAATPTELAELRDDLASGRRVPPELAARLVEDGLLDRTLGLTARGRRALALDDRPARPGEECPETRAISVRGDVPGSARVALDRMLARVAASSPGPVTGSRAALARESRRAGGRPFVATARLDVAGTTVRASATADTVAETIAALDARLRRLLHDLSRRGQPHDTHRPAS
jgi:hypothetical protein